MYGLFPNQGGMRCAPGEPFVSWGCKKWIMTLLTDATNQVCTRSEDWLGTTGVSVCIYARVW